MKPIKKTKKQITVYLGAPLKKNTCLYCVEKGMTMVELLLKVICDVLKEKNLLVSDKKTTFLNYKIKDQRNYDHYKNKTSVSLYIPLMKTKLDQICNEENKTYSEILRPRIEQIIFDSD